MNAAHHPAQEPHDAAQPVLLFGQSPEDHDALTRSLAEAGLRVEARAVSSPDDLAKALGERAGHVILAYLVDEASVRDLVELARRHDPGAPLVVVATGAAPRVAALIRAGARDAVLAADTEHLAAVIEREAATAQQARNAAGL